MARKAFAVTDAMRERVRYLAGVGVPQDEIAKIIGCAAKTLRKRFRDDLDRGVAEATATVCGFLFAAAKGGSIPAIIFWLKTRAHWREKNVPEDPVARGKLHNALNMDDADRVGSFVTRTAPTAAPASPRCRLGEAFSRRSV